MTRTEVTRLIKKLHHRKKMLSEVKEMEERLAVYLASHNLTELRIPGLKAALINNSIVITATPLIDDRQLNFLADYFCLEYQRR
jgi:hypothetical protein